MPKDGENLLPFEEREINDRLYRVSRLKLSKWFELTDMMAKLLGEPFADVLYGRASVDIRSLMSAEAMSSVFGLAMREISKDKMSKLIDFMGHVVEVDHGGDWKRISKGEAEYYWPTRIADLAHVGGLFFEVQYVDFFDGLREFTSSLLSDPEGQDQKMGEPEAD